MQYIKSNVNFIDLKISPKYILAYSNAKKTEKENFCLANIETDTGVVLEQLAVMF